LKKRDAFRAAFDNFDPEKMAAYGEADRARLMADPGIVRSNAKIDAAIGSAKIYLAMRDGGEDFSKFCWDFVGGKPIQNSWAWGEVPAQTPLAVEFSKALKKRGFKFVGPVIVYAWMQATGLVNDHVVTCFRHDEVKA
jgi:DNA-3-methyladenine glycosylase I